ncbi:MAG: hypothetical protein ACLGRW_15540 [Acidobacteriota bacterium]|jgi:hypothetical protein
MNHGEGRFWFWLPRAASIVFAAFLSLFALDIFQVAHGFWQTALALSIHLIPSAVILAVLVVAWRWEWVGAIFFAALAAFYVAMVLPAHPSWALGISGPLVAIAGMFLLSWIKRREARQAR